jgi:hypothetical protein
MKTKEELKEELHKMIDSIEDESALNILKEDLVPYAISYKEDVIDDDLSPEENYQLKKAIEQADRGETITMEEFKEATKRWRK